MHIRHNVGAVQQRLRQLAQAVPEAMARANEPTGWVAGAEALATATLLRLARTEAERQQVAGFVALVRVQARVGGFALQLSAPRADEWAQDVEAARGRVAQALAQNEAPDAGDLQQAVAWWVEHEKRKDARDRHSDYSPKSDDDIAQFIYFLLTTRDEKLVGGRKHASHQLEGAITEWLTNGQVTLPRATVDLWLRTVLAAWREWVRVEWPQRFRREFRALRQEGRPA